MIKYIFIISILITSCATQYVPTQHVATVYPHIERCPDLVPPTPNTIGSSIIYNYGLYYQCQARVNNFANWVDRQIKKQGDVK